MKRRSGYSLLELIIAMSLLVGLLAAGWSVLSAYRDAEMRGWTLAQRIQTVQMAREWLESDLLQIVPLQHNGESFVGNATGFIATIKPSVDPLPFLVRRLDGLEWNDTDSQRNLAATSPDESIQGENANRLWPPKQWTVEYRLKSIGESSDEASTSWILVRHTRVSARELRRDARDSNDESTQRELTLSDLYRTQEDAEVESQVAVHNQQLRGLTHAKFSYFDGQQWKSSWDSRSTGTLPFAVALAFNVDPKISGKEPLPIEESSSTEESEQVDWLAEPEAEDSVRDDSQMEFDVRVVVSLRNSQNRLEQGRGNSTPIQTGWTSTPAIPALRQRRRRVSPNQRKRRETLGKAKLISAFARSSLRTDNASKRSRSGMALLVVLVLVMLAALAAYGFVWTMENHYRISRAREDQVYAKQAALSGIEVVAAILEQAHEQRSDSGRLTDNPDLFRSIAVEMPEEGRLRTGEIPQWHAKIVSPHFHGTENTGAQESSSGTSSLSSSSSEASDEEPAGFHYGLQNESAKIHLPTLVAWDRAQPGHARRVLMSLPGATEPVAEAWLKELGIEPSMALNSSTSTASDRQANPSGNSSDRVQQSWFGSDLNQNYKVDAMEAPAIPIGWRNYLTWNGGSRNESFSGRPRIHLNQADLQNLHRELLDVWPADWANFVVLYRQFGPAGPSGGSGEIDAASATLDFSVAGSVPIRSPVELIGVSILLHSGGDSANRRIASPFRREMVQSSDYLGKILDDVTTGDGATYEGRIDITDAPVEVLLAVPGLERELAERIVAQRLTQSTGTSGSVAGLGNRSGETSVPTIAWLIEDGLVDLVKLAQLEPYLTARSDVYSCQIIGTKDAKHSEYRCTVIIDAKSKPAIVRDFQIWHTWGRF